MKHLLVLGIMYLCVYTLPIHAQETTPYVCHDTTYPTLRFEFRNLPTLETGISWAYLADGGTFTDAHTFIADALTEYPYNEVGITAGMVVLMTSDYTFELRGDETTVPCDMHPLPEITPQINAQADACPAWAINGSTGGKVCLWLLPRD